MFVSWSHMKETKKPVFDHFIIDRNTPLNPHIKSVGDITGNGRADVVVPSSAEGPLVWYEQTSGASEWRKYQIAPQGRWSCDAKVVDMDGDGDFDILISEWYTHDRLEWYENPRPDGDPRTDPWKRHIIGPPRAHHLEVADLDGDGHIEIITRTQDDDGDKIVIRKRVSETWITRVLKCPAGEGLAIGDMNGNGRLDIVIGGRWFETPTDILDGEWQERVFADWPGDATVVLHDMNGNGLLDVVMTRSEGCHHLSWFEAPESVPERASAGTSAWVEHVVDESLDYGHSLKVCDMTGNGLPDIVTAEMHQSERKRVLIYLNQGASLSWEPMVLSEKGSHMLCVADTTGDGRPDIIGANWSGDYQLVELWLNRG